MQFSYDFFRVLFSRKTIHDLQFRKLDIDRIIVFAEEDFDIVLEYRWPSLNDEENISECDILHFRTR